MTRSTSARERGRARGFWRLLASLVLLGATLSLFDLELYRHLQRLDPTFLVLGLLLATLQFPLLATRWWFLSKRLQARLGFREALREYYLSTLLNQVVPLGVAGDALRTLRHGATLRALDPPLQGVTSRVLMAWLTDRASGQLALWLVVLALAPGWWNRQAFDAGVGGGAILAAAFVAACALMVSARRPAVRGFWREGGALLLAPNSLCVHLPLSLALLLLHASVFWAAARAVGTDIEALQVARIVPLMLVATTLPAFFAGWGIREAAAAGLYLLSGLPSSAGVSASIVFGVIGLLASTPGLFTLLTSPSRVPTTS